MKAMILAAGLGTRLKPWTLSHPKALVPVGGVPMLERVIRKLVDQGFDYIVVNVHHFAGQIVEFLANHDFGVSVRISDESSRLLDTGGGILHAKDLLSARSGPVLVHNVDILSNADLRALMVVHELSGADSTLLVSSRESGRKLIFDRNMILKGWHHLVENRYLPEDYCPAISDSEFAFSGIHVIGERALEEMSAFSKDEKFSIIDFLLSPLHSCKISGYVQEDLRLIDIGKPATLSQAQDIL